MWLKIEKVMNFSEERKTLSKNISKHPVGVARDVLKVGASSELTCLLTTYRLIRSNNSKMTQRVVNISGLRCPASPRQRRLTRPLGPMVRMVREACFREIRSQASGGSWRARQTKYLMTLAWQTMIS